MDRASMAMFLVGVACAAMQGVVHAQDVGKHGADYTYAPDSPKYWRNMHSTKAGSFVFQRDPNVWVYTREVAERAGLPLEWASDELKGVAAAAFRMEPNSRGPFCGWGGNPKACKPEMQCVLELYFDRQTQPLPWAPNRPIADFDWQGVSTAFHLVAVLGGVPEANGDRSRSTRGSPNYPSLGARSPFSDPKTGDELGFAHEGSGATKRVLAYDKEIHSRYAFVRLSDLCGRSKFAYQRGEVIQLRKVAGANISETSPVYYQLELPLAWVNRIRQLTADESRNDENFYKGIWNQVNEREGASK